MAIALEKSVFFHMPKTGGSWVRHTLTTTGIKWKGISDFHSTKIPLEFKKKFKFTFIRNPASWYISYWRCNWHRKRLEDKQERLFDCINEKESKNFNTWLERILEESPSHVTKAINHFTKDCDFVGKQENLRKDLILALSLAGENFSAEDIRKQKINESLVAKPFYKKNIYLKMTELEKEVFKKYKYDIFI